MTEEGKSTISAPFILTVEFLLAFFLAAYLLHKYGNIRKQNLFVTVSTLVVWFLSFVIIFLLPVDVSSAFYQLCLSKTDFNVTVNSSDGNTTIKTFSCDKFVCSSEELRGHTQECYSCFQPYSFICTLPLEILWYIIYWLFFVLSWVVLPVGQSYVLASYFSVWKRILRALIENAIFYVTLLLIFVALLIYLVAKQYISIRDLPFLLATASNTWGLLILALLLGYGLVEVPRTLWYASRRTYSLNHCYFKAAKLYSDMSDANEKLNEVTERVKLVSQKLHYNDPMRKYVDIIIKKFPEDLRDEFSKGHDDYEDFRTAGEDLLTKSSLESLFKKTTKAVRLSNSTKIHWLALTDQTLDLEDIELNAGSKSRYFQSSVRPVSDSWRKSWLPYLEWYWKLWLRPWVYKVTAALIAILSFSIVWSEVTFSITKVRLSIFASLIYAGDKVSNYIAVEMLSICMVAYLSICTYYSVFKLRIFNLYYLAPRHATDEYSLLFSAVLLSRLALPVCLNYLYMIQVVRLEYHDDEEVPQTAFAYATGNTELIPWLTSYFYIYYPALIVLVCIATLLSLGTRLVAILGYQMFIGEDDFSADYIDEGKALMKRERRLRERSLRENGKAASRPFELLREVRTSVRYSQLRSERARQSQRGIKEVEEQSSLGKFVSRAKNLATKSKATVSAKYTASRGRGQEDVVELLPSSREDDSDSRPRSLRRDREPPRGIFDDL